MHTGGVNMFGDEGAIYVGQPVSYYPTRAICDVLATVRWSLHKPIHDILQLNKSGFARTILEVRLARGLHWDPLSERKVKPRFGPRWKSNLRLLPFIEILHLKYIFVDVNTCEDLYPIYILVTQYVAQFYGCLNSFTLR